MPPDKVYVYMKRFIQGKYSTHIVMDVYDSFPPLGPWKKSDIDSDIYINSEGDQLIERLLKKL
jgi:hypothetical protein